MESAVSSALTEQVNMQPVSHKKKIVNRIRVLYMKMHYSVDYKDAQFNSISFNLTAEILIIQGEIKKGSIN